tara:strand:+ start:221 stop:520 length:300 start_codon:yes stop_codon:yes gene_type:complete
MFKMAKIKIEDTLFWILVFATIFVMIWKLFGSPTDVGTIIGIGTFLLTSEILTWKKIFAIENKTTIGFMKVKHDLSLMENRMNNRFDKIESKLDKIWRK